MAREEKLNIFRSVTDPLHYEGPLTRALLIVLDLSPRAHAAWLKLVAPRHQLDQLPEAMFRAEWPDPVSRSTTSERVMDVVLMNVAA